MPYAAPQIDRGAFNCPHCGAFAHQEWKGRDGDLSTVAGRPVRTSICAQCQKAAVWVFDTMVYPDRANAPLPNADLPDDVKKAYEEAALISSRSPRAASALLRLAIETLCKGLEPKAGNLNEAVGKLVRKGLPEQIQQSLDIVRVTGNNAVHPGQIDVDSPEVVSQLFTLVNLIAAYTMTMPKIVSTLYERLPQSDRDKIERRDAGAS